MRKGDRHRLGQRRARPTSSTAVAAAGLRRGRDLRQRPRRLARCPRARSRARCADLGLRDRPVPAGPRRRGRRARSGSTPCCTGSRSKLDVMAELGASTRAGLLQRRARRQSTTSTSRPSSCTRSASSPPEHGVTVAYEALAWGRHVNRVGQAWEAVRARRPPGGHPGRRHLPHALARRRRLRARGHPGRPDRLPAGRRRAAARHERARVEPALPLLPGPGHARRHGRRRRHPARRATAVRSRSRCSATSCARPTRRSPLATRCARCVFLEDQLAAVVAGPARELVTPASPPPAQADGRRSSSSPARSQPAR